MWTELMRPGARCTALKLNLKDVGWSERIFRVFIALTLPAVAILRALDLLLTAQGIRVGAVELDPIGEIILDQVGFFGLVLLNVAMVVALVIGVWLIYGISIYLRQMGGKGPMAYHILEVALILFLVWHCSNLLSVVLHNYEFLMGLN